MSGAPEVNAPTPDAPDVAARPLAGVLVVDLSRYLPGPLVTRLLADLGARVIKIEEPTLGDPVRHDPQGKDGESALAAMLLAGHESVALDLKREPARDVLEELLLDADVLVESFRPGALARIGLAPAELQRRYPKLVVCSLSGFGQDGPHAARAGHDLTYQALAGALASGDAAWRVRMPAVQVADVAGAWSAASAVLAALYRRERSGEGAHVDQALLDAAGHAAITAWAAESTGPKEVGEPLFLTGALPCYDLYPTADGGHLAFAALEPKFWRRFCEALERKDLSSRQYSSDPAVRREVAALVAQRGREEWAAFMAEHDIPAEPVLSPSEALEHPQVEHRDLVRHGEDEMPRLGFPARIDGERPRGGEDVPQIGEHTAEVIEEFGLARELPGWRRRFVGIGRRMSWRRLGMKVVQKLARK